MSLVLLVEDEPLVARLHARAITNAGYSISLCSDGEAALESLEATPPDIMVTDLNMPGLSGFELTRTARAQGFCMPIILLSGDDTVSLLSDGLRAGMDDFLVKGMPFARLAAVLHFWTGGPWRRLPAHIRDSVLDFFALAWPMGPPIAQLHHPMKSLEARAAAAYKDLILHAPDGFGQTHADHVRMLGVADGILTTLTRSQPLARLRQPELMTRLLAHTPAAAAHLPLWEQLLGDATFLHARETLRLA